jgi:hypothetical protein
MALHSTVIPTSNKGPSDRRYYTINASSLTTFDSLTEVAFTANATSGGKYFFMSTSTLFCCLLYCHQRWQRGVLVRDTGVSKRPAGPEKDGMMMV